MMGNPPTEEAVEQRTVVLRRSKAYAARSLRNVIIFFTVVWVIVLYQQWWWVGIGLLLFTVIGLKNSIAQLSDDTIQLEVNPEGIIAKGQARLPWVAVRDAWLQHKTNAIVLELEDGSRVEYEINRLDMTPSQLLRLVKEHLTRSSPHYVIYKEGAINRLLRQRRAKAATPQS